MTSDALAADAPTPQERPNILFVFTDDHGYQATGPDAYPSRFDQLQPTPTIDRLARQGMVFENCFVTNSICGPSRATIQTGKYSHKNGFFRNGMQFNPDQQTFPKLLQKAGYQTAVIGKWHLGTKPQGYDYYEVLYGQGPYYNPPMRTPAGRVTHTGYTTNVITDQALKQQRDPDQPFMLMYQHKAPHRRWKPGPKHLNLYDDVKIPEPDTLFDDYENRASPARNQEMEIARHMNRRDLKLAGAPGRLTDAQAAKWNAAYQPKNERFREQRGQMTDKEIERWKYQRYAKDYLRCMKSVDDNLDRVLRYLEEAGLAENTIVIYSSDQGWYLGEHGWYDKRWMYEQSLRTPLIVRWPDHIKPNTRNDAFVSNLDFAQTFLDLAGAPIPDDMQGRSLVPLMKGNGPEDWRDSFYYHYYENPGWHNVARHYGVRADRYKLIHYYRKDEWELFDLKKDPRELNSVYGDAGYAEVQKRLKRQLKRLQKKYDETDPENSIENYRRRQARQALKDVEVTEVLAVDSPDARVDRKPDIAGKSFTVGAHVTPKDPDGVVISQGGTKHGYSLYLKEGVPHFSVYAGGEHTKIKADASVPMNERAHLAAQLDDKSRMVLYVNGQTVAHAKARPIPDVPGHPLALGRDTRDPSGDYNHANVFDGRLDDIRLYYGALSRKAVRQWAESH
jgi:arylsulfatase A-like enzyme